MKKLFVLFFILWGSSSFAFYWLDGYKAELLGDYKKAAIFYKKSCIYEGDPLSCISLGMFYIKGLGVEKSYSKANPYLVKGCRYIVKTFGKNNKK